MYNTISFFDRLCSTHLLRVAEGIARAEASRDRYFTNVEQIISAIMYFIPDNLLILFKLGNTQTHKYMTLSIIYWTQIL